MLISLKLVITKEKETDSINYTYDDPEIIKNWTHHNTQRAILKDKEIQPL